MFAAGLILAALLSTIVTVSADTPAPELQGLWVGNEKFPYVVDGEQVLLEFCSQVIFNPPGETQGGLLDWIVADGYCPDAGFDISTGEFSQNWFQKLSLPDHFYEIVEEGDCLSFDDERCNPYDVLPNVGAYPHNFDDGWEIEATACGSNTRRLDITRPNTAYCDLWMVILLTREVDVPAMEESLHHHDEDMGKTGKKKGKKKGKDIEDNESVTSTTVTEKILVVTDTYGYAFAANDDGVTQEEVCPTKFAYRDEDLLGNNLNAEGSFQGVLQQTFFNTETFETIDLTDPCNWECFDKEEYGCDDLPSSVGPPI